MPKIGITTLFLRPPVLTVTRPSSSTQVVSVPSNISWELSFTGSPTGIDTDANSSQFEARAIYDDDTFVEEQFMPIFDVQVTETAQDGLYSGRILVLRLHSWDKIWDLIQTLL